MNMKQRSRASRSYCNQVSSRGATPDSELRKSLKACCQRHDCKGKTNCHTLSSLWRIREAVTLHSAETPTATLSPNEWSLMEVLRLLEPFEEYTKLMSNDNSCISEVIPAITVLKKFLAEMTVRRQLEYAQCAMS